MIIDPTKELTWAVSPPKSQTNNTGAFLADLSNFQGGLAVTVAVGTKTAGDSDGAITLGLQSSTTNNISNATNYTPTFGVATINTSNNATTSGQLFLNPRDVVGRYVFWRVTVSGTNTPAYPIAVVAVGEKKVQP